MSDITSTHTDDELRRKIREMGGFDEQQNRQEIVTRCGDRTAKQHCRELVDKGIPYGTACEMACYSPVDEIEDAMVRWVRWAVVGAVVVLSSCAMWRFM